MKLKSLSEILIVILSFVVVFFVSSCAITLKDIGKWRDEGSKGIPKLIKVAEDTEVDVKLRLAAVRALGGMRDARIVQPLLDLALADRDPAIREAAVAGLIGLGKPAADALIRVAQDPKGEVKLRLAAVKVLGGMGDARAVQPLLGIALADKNLSLREAAVDALIGMRKPATEALLKVTQDVRTDVKLRLASIRALGNMGDARVVQPLLSIALADKEPAVREAAVNALIRLREPATDALFKLAQDPRSEVKLRLAAVRALGGMRDARIVQPLLDLALADRDPAIREAAVAGLITLGEPAAEAIIRVAKDTRVDAKLRLVALKALGGMEDARIVQPLLGIALTDKDPGLREEAVNTLIALGKPATDALIKVAQDPRSEVKLRLAVVKALENAGDGRAVQPLLSILLTDKDPRMREAVNSVLVAMGRQATVGGSVQKIDKSSQTIIITTPMGKQEVLQLSPATSIKKRNRKASLKDLSSGQDVKMEYLVLPGDKALVTEVLVGVYVPHCSCRDNCPCPIPRGCKVIEYD